MKNVLNRDLIYQVLSAVEEIPAGRFGTAEEAAQVILMLAEGPEYLTGQIVTVSGGWQI